MHKAVAVVVLNYKGKANTLSCVKSLKQLINSDSLEIHVVDNASEDGVLSELALNYPDVVCHQSDSNKGYSGGNNIAIGWILLNRPEINYVWVLNNDTQVTPDCLDKLLQQAHQHPKALIGSCLKYPNGRFQRLASKLNALNTKLVDYAEHEVFDGGKVASLSGASWLIPVSIFKAIGLLPEQYFLYFEDNDYCFKAWQAGFECRVAKQAVVYHQESMSTKQLPDLLNYYYQRNRLIFLKQFVHPITFAWVVWPYTLWRWFRAKCKNAKQAQVFGLAIQDFKQGVLGPCPHRALYPL